MGREQARVPPLHHEGDREPEVRGPPHGGDGPHDGMCACFLGVRMRAAFPSDVRMRAAFF